MAPSYPGEMTMIPPAALLTAIGAAVGWVVAQYFTLWRDDRAKRLQFTIEHAERQITEFYAPLIALLEKLHTTAGIKIHIERSAHVDEDKRAFFDRYVYYEYFLKQHTEIQDVLSRKIHLLEGWKIPESYSLYLKHFTSENIFNALRYKEGQPFAFQVDDYPPSFIDDLREGQDIVLKRYEDCLAEQRRPLFPVWAKGPVDDTVDLRRPAE